MVKETPGQEKFLLTTIIHFEHYYEIKKRSAVRSRISSKLIFASCVGYFDRAYCGFYVTSSRMLVLIEGNILNLTAVELTKCTSTKYHGMWLWICMQPYLH